MNEKGGAMILKEYVKIFKVDKKKFAKDVGTSFQYINHIINGRKNAGREMAKRIAKSTNGQCSVFEVMFPEEFQKQKEHKNG